REEPAVLAVLPTQRERIVPRLPGLGGSLDPCDDTLQVIGMLDFRPVPALHLLEGQACVIEPALVVPRDVAERVTGPGELGDVVGDGPEAIFGLAQRDFSARTFNRFPSPLGRFLRQRDLLRRPRPWAARMDGESGDELAALPERNADIRANLNSRVRRTLGR